ncbi:MAG: hypothetical protein QMD08_05860 [Actinomycetota bacterium]|nr:hypothetical protein [Actinomycetota bacterium]
MTKREREVFEVVKELRRAHPNDISERMGISPGYAEQLCRDMVWLRYLVKKGSFYEITPKYRS